MREGRLPLSIIVPVYEEAGCLREFHARLVKIVEGLGAEVEVIYVDDGSRDESPTLLAAFQRANSAVRVVRLSRNFGQQSAVHAGFVHARGELVVTLDADLQNPPEEIPKLLEAMREGVSVVAGVRSPRRDGWLRVLSSRCVNWLIGRLTGVRLRDYGCLMRGYRRPVVDALLRMPEQRAYFTALLPWLGCTIAEVEVDHQPRRSGRSRYGLRKLLSLSLDIVMGHTLLPVSAILATGVVFGSVGVVTIGFAVVDGLGDQERSDERWLWGGIGALLFGILLASIGIVGEYAGRALFEVRKRPLYVLAEQLSGAAEQRSRAAGERTPSIEPR